VSKYARGAFAVLLGLYLALAVSYSLADPVYESTDELRHFRYVRHLIAYRELPVQREGAPRAQSHHPPLYYALGALVSGWVPVEQDVYYKPAKNPFWGYRYWEVGDDNKNQYVHGDDERFPFRGVTLAIYLVRWLTVLIGAGTVWLTYRIGREILPDQPALALGSAALVAFNPQFLYLSGAVNNDVPAALCGAAILLACVRLVQAGQSARVHATMGLLFGLALLTKFNLLALLAPIELACLIAARRAGEQTDGWRAFLRGNLRILGMAVLISGWWFVRNWRLYGDPTGMNMLNDLWSGRPATGHWWVIRQSLPYLWSSLWGRFGYGQVPLPEPLYQGLLIFCAVAVGGYLLPRRRSLPGAAMLLLGMAVLAYAAVVFTYMLIQPAGAMGRFFFPGLPALAVLICLGLGQVFPWRMTWAAGLVVTVGMAALAIYALAGTLAPAFARPRPLAEPEIADVPNPTDVEFTPSTGLGAGLSIGSEHSGVARLLGYRITPATVEPGGVIEVTLYWQALARTDRNYAVFVHLLSEVGTMVAQRDTYPGLGRYPTTAWEPGVTFADTYRVHVPETAYAPDVGYIQVGLYLPDGPRLTTPDGRDALRLETVEVCPLEGELPNPLDVNFGDQVALVGYTLDRRMVHPGDTIRLTLYWQALAAMEIDYAVFAHVLGVENQVWANSDGMPAGGTESTRHWQPGQVIEDVHELTVGQTTPPDFYDIEVGLHALEGDRLPVIAEDGRWLGKQTLLSKIRVVDDE
jgi:4-amino-4-deoxy-L-arabinose transferase-like glycosyltransferase